MNEAKLYLLMKQKSYKNSQRLKKKSKKDKKGFLLEGSVPFCAGHFCKANSPAFVGGQHRKESNVQLQYAENRN